jgi:two-component system nitrate/nitrite response regulator NarL
MNKIRVAILDDHQAIIDGYVYRLSQASDIEVVVTATYAEEFEDLLAQQKPDVLLLDVFVPISSQNQNYYPILQAIPKWLQSYRQLSILVISAHNLRALIKAVIEAGASGFILKEDQTAFQELGSIIRSVARGGIYFSKKAYQHMQEIASEDSPLTSRQLQVLSLCAAYPDATTSELADMLGVAHSTLRNLLSQAYLRLGVRTRTAAIEKARKMGLIAVHEPIPGSL